MCIKKNKTKDAFVHLKIAADIILLSTTWLVDLPASGGCVLFVYPGSFRRCEDGQLWRHCLRRSAPALRGFVRRLLCGALTCTKSPLVWFWHAALSHRALCRMYRAIQTLCRVEWVLSSGWRLNVMALSPGRRVFYSLMLALIRCSTRSAPPRRRSASALSRSCVFMTRIWVKTGPLLEGFRLNKNRDSDVA